MLFLQLQVHLRGYIHNTGSYSISTFILTVTSNSITDNSFRVYDLLLDEVQNGIYIAQSGIYGGYNNSFTIYDVLLLELINEGLINQ